MSDETNTAERPAAVAWVDPLPDETDDAEETDDESADEDDDL
jgi:hypothetical protein